MRRTVLTGMTDHTLSCQRSVTNLDNGSVTHRTVSGIIPNTARWVPPIRCEMDYLVFPGGLGSPRSDRLLTELMAGYLRVFMR